MIVYRRQRQEPELDPKYIGLEFRLDKSRDIPFIVGYNIRADDVYSPSESWGTPEQIAKGKSMPLEAVEQAIGWCKENQDLVFRIWRETRRRAGLPD